MKSSLVVQASPLSSNYHPELHSWHNKELSELGILQLGILHSKFPFYGVKVPIHFLHSGLVRDLSCSLKYVSQSLIVEQPL